MSFEVKVKRLSHRNWKELATLWLPHIAQLTITYPGQPPEVSLSQFHGLKGIADALPKDGEYRADLHGLRSAQLHEAIYVLHKAANVLVASHQQVRGGLPTWSIATAYQSAFFSMEALLMLLGISIVEVNNKTIVIDIWPEVDSKASKKEKALYKLGSEIQYIAHSRIEHYHRWAILKRVLRTLSDSPLSNDFINAICEIDDKKFAKQRNRLHYSNTWIFDDLHSSFSSISYCRFQLPFSLAERLDPDHIDFTVVLATTLFSSAASLLASLSTISPLIASERNLLDSACKTDRMQLRADYEQTQINPMV